MNTNNLVNEDTRSIRSTSSRPPAYSIEDETISPPTIPFSAHIPLNSTTSIPSLNNSQISLPSYDHAKVDMPPQYPHLKIDVNSPWELVPIEPQQPWPITKKLYIFGFLIWPFWYIGAVYSIFGKDEATKTWGQLPNYITAFFMAALDNSYFTREFANKDMDLSTLVQIPATKTVYHHLSFEK
ncbi:9607_t:CDS:2 [Gigaspora margarita]|uniref:9607_t:CDS:1 n=1 Tax=Gigaspora margarita TaxID=4874 RepID=A0ABN7VAC8_GIGMA|nr:9607_t:CDS:2 [Gigaspora margarita]